MGLSSLFGKLHFLMMLVLAVLTTFMVLQEEKRIRMYLLIAVLVLQHVILILFMLRYESLGRLQWKKREKALRKELLVQNKITKSKK